ncbi:MAG TPA: large conductance mechanosensitive channel protein MscL [Ktedonobacteraceae bacterium]|nr:large conductance mechanosensitive channel protein MscL [Ktedonobacteraceae bacterium]
MASQRISQAGKSAASTLGGFKTFVLRGNVVDLAVGIVIGAAFTSIVTAFVSDVITPLIPAPGGNLSTWAIIIPWTGKPLLIGALINAIVAFLIVAAVIYYFVVLPVNALMARYKKDQPVTPPATRDCPYCLSSIPVMATRCAYCTSPLQPAGFANPTTATT